MKTWHVVCVEPHMEGRAQSHLRRQRFECVWLKFRNQVKRHGRLIDTFSSLFPGYLFVSLTPQDQWHPIERTPGCMGLIMSGDRPAPLPANEAHDLFARADCSGTIHLDPERPESRPTYLPGSDVRVTDGPFVSFIGQFIGRTAEERVAILLDLFGRKTRVVFDEQQIEAA